MGDRKSNFVFALGCLCKCIRKKIEAGGPAHFVALSRKFTSFWCKNLASFSREDFTDMSPSLQHTNLLWRVPHSARPQWWSHPRVELWTRLRVYVACSSQDTHQEPTKRLYHPLDGTLLPITGFPAKRNIVHYKIDTQLWLYYSLPGWDVNRL